VRPGVFPNLKEQIEAKLVKHPSGENSDQPVWTILIIVPRLCWSLAARGGAIYQNYVFWNTSKLIG